MILKQIFTIVGEVTPIIGDVVDNIKSKDGGVGRFFTPRFIKQVTRLIITIACVYLLVKGDISIEQLEEFTK